MKKACVDRVLAPICWLPLTISFLSLCMVGSSAIAAEYALIVGGGPNSSRNPVSLETQVLQAISVLQARKLEQIDLFFADGDSPEPDLVDRADATNKEKMVEAEAAQKYLRLLYGPGHFQPRPTRNHRVPQIQGAATNANIRNWFQQQGAKLENGDQLLIYFAAHGARTEAELDQPAESEVLLWNDERMTAPQLRSLIQELPVGVRVMLLMSGCYSSGFAEPGQINLFGLPDQTRIVGGFFSSLPDRPAAGCTPQAFSPQSRDYATCFWAAQLGKLPDGAKLTQDPDRDQDGKVTFAEAHAFALLTDNTLDTPQKRSDIVLRKISRFGKIAETNLLMDNASYEDILASASELDAHVLNQLSEQLKLTGRRRMAAARRELRKLGEIELPALLEERLKLIAELKPLRNKLSLTLKATYADWSLEKLQAVAAAQSNFPHGFVETIEASKEFADIQQKVKSLHKIDQQRLDLEAKWAGYWRFISVAETVILTYNFRQIANSKWEMADFQRILREENEY